MPGVVVPAGHRPVASPARQQRVRSQRPFCASARRQQAAIIALSSTVRLAGFRGRLLHSPVRQQWQRQHATPAVTAEAATSAKFTVPSQPLAFGEHIRLVGSAPELGSWDPSEGLVLEWAEGDDWSAEASLAVGSIEFKVVVAKGDGSFHWEELAEGANRIVQLSGDSLAVTCHMGGSTDVSSGGSSGGAGAAVAAESASNEKADPASAIDMSVDMDAAKELNPAFNVQASYDGAEGVDLGAADDAPVSGAENEPAVESEAAELVEEKIGGQEQVPQTYQVAGPPAEDSAPEPTEAAAGEGGPADEEESAQDTAGANSGAAAEGVVQRAAVNDDGGAEGKKADVNPTAGAGKAAAHGDGQFLGRSDVEVKEDGSITFSLNPEDDSVQQLAADILRRLQQ